MRGLEGDSMCTILVRGDSAFRTFGKGGGVISDNVACP